MKQLRRVLPLIDAGAESPQEPRTRLVLIRGGLPRPQTQIVVRNIWGAVVARIDMGWVKESGSSASNTTAKQHWTDPLIRANDIDRTAELLNHHYSSCRQAQLQKHLHPLAHLAKELMAINRELFTSDINAEIESNNAWLC